MKAAPAVSLRAARKTITARPRYCRARFTYPPIGPTHPGLIAACNVECGPPAAKGLGDSKSVHTRQGTRQWQWTVVITPGLLGHFVIGSLVH